jgi:hypothetical protein
VPNRSRKPPSDPAEAAFAILTKLALTDADPEPEPPLKNAAAVELGRKGGLKGGKARAASLTDEQRRESAKKAAAARWGQRPPSDEK